MPNLEHRLFLRNAYHRRPFFALGLACCAVLVAGLVFFGHMTGQPDPASSAPVLGIEAPFDARLQHALSTIADANLPVVVGVSHKGGPIRIQEFGSLDEDWIDPETMQIDINSVTKTVTAVMTAKLVDDGKIRFDETLSEIFPDVPEDKAGITLHQLLTHSAGLVEAVGDDEEPVDRQEFLERVFRSKLLSPPGEAYAYSNVGYGLIAAIIELRSGKIYEEYLQQDVLSGLGFENTGYLNVYDKTRSIRTKNGQDIWEASWGGHAPFWNLIGNGGLLSTVPEMLRFRRAVLEGKIVQPETLTAIHTAHISEDEDAVSHYGYGLVVQDVKGIGRVYWHDGGNDLFSAQWGDYADQEDLIFVAGLDDDLGNAFEAMQILETYLYGRKDG